ncbi:MAG: glycosyltransferase [Candidatus Jordarchaeales archaeon]
MRKLFSVVIPTYNEEKYLPHCLKSLLSQTIPRESYEIIIVDGYSEDKTVKLAEGVVNKIIVAERKGPGNARNIGSKMAKGRILLFLDADTIITPNFMEKVYDSFVPGVVGGTCDIYPLEADPRAISLYKLINRLYRLLYIAGFPHAQTKCCFYLRRAFLDAGGFNENLKVAEDQELAWRMSKKGRMVYVNGVAAYSSMRREKAKGYAATVKDWVKNYLMVALMGRSQDLWEPIR